MKFIRLFAVVVLLVLFSFGAMFLTEYLNTSSTDGETVVIEIPEGSAGKTMAKILKENHLIRFENAFLLRLRNSEYSGRLRSGSFELHKGMCIDDIIQELASGGITRAEITVTFPEGFSVEQMAARLEDKGLFSAIEFLDEVNNGKFDYDFLSSVPENANIKYRLQGFLFPSTYSFFEDSSPHDVIETMLAEFNRRYSAITQCTSTADLFHIVTEASLVEREAKIDSERATIAGVIENRLADGMRLQIDAAVVYTVSDGLYNVDRVLYKDLEVDSPYNVYKNYGLPAGPICNPGEASLRAAMNPQQHSYFFYHTDETKKDGSHIFTESFGEHKATMTK